MLSTTPILYCKRAALHHAPDTRPIDPWALPPVPLSSLAEPRLLTLGAPRRPRRTLKVSVTRVICASVLFLPDHNCTCARPWKNGLVQEATFTITMCLAPPLLCARGVSRQRGNSLYTPLTRFRLRSRGATQRAR